MAGLTNTGFEKKQISQIREEFQQALITTFGPTIDLTEGSVFNQLITIMAEREASLWDLLLAVYNSQYPNFATGVQLDNAVLLTGTSRLAATRSTTTLTFTGTQGTVIAVGFLVTNTLVNGPQFRVTTAGTIPAEGTIDLPAEAVNTGAIEALSGSLTVIVNPQNGVNAVTNANDAIIGRATETDTELRLRQATDLQSSGNATLNALRSKLLTVTGATQVFVAENTTGSVDSNGLPSHSFEAFIFPSGLSSSEIGQILIDNKPVGIQSHGDISIAITDDGGIERIVQYSNFQDFPIYVIARVIGNVDATEGELYPQDGNTLVAAAVLEYGESLSGGNDIHTSRFIPPIFAAVVGINSLEVKVATTTPTDINDFDDPAYSTGSIVIAINQIAAFDSSRITVINS